MKGCLHKQVYAGNYLSHHIGPCYIANIAHDKAVDNMWWPNVGQLSQKGSCMECWHGWWPPQRILKLHAMSSFEGTFNILAFLNRLFLLQLLAPTPNIMWKHRRWIKLILSRFSVLLFLCFCSFLTCKSNQQTRLCQTYYTTYLV